MLDYILEHSDVLNFLGVLFATIIPIVVYRFAPRYSFIEEKYNKLVFPLFTTVEPFLYTQVPFETLNEILSIIESNKSLSSGKLYESYYYCFQNPSQDNYNSLCTCISNEYDWCCAFLGLKRRSIYYRLARKQYKTKFMLICWVILHVLLFLLLFFFTLLCVGLFTIILEKLGILLPT